MQVLLPCASPEMFLLGSVVVWRFSPGSGQPGPLATEDTTISSRGNYRKTFFYGEATTSVHSLVGGKVIGLSARTHARPMQAALGRGSRRKSA